MPVATTASTRAIHGASCSMLIGLFPVKVMLIVSPPTGTAGVVGVVIGSPFIMYISNCAVVGWLMTPNHNPTIVLLLIPGTVPD